LSQRCRSSADRDHAVAVIGDQRQAMGTAVDAHQPDAIVDVEEGNSTRSGGDTSV
jgi:hypothetical protein